MANTDYKGSGGGSFTPLAELAEGVDYLDTILKLKGYSLPGAGSLTDGLAALVDDEIMIVTHFSPDQCTVKRGAGDTVPNKHAADALVWFFSATTGRDPKEHAGGEDLSVKVQPSTIGGGTLPVEASPPNGITMNWRYYRPYPPGQMLAENHSWFLPSYLTSTDPNLILTWADRDRKMQADKLFDHSVGNIGPEPGTTYTARVYLGDPTNGDIRRTEVGIIGYNTAPPNSVRINSWAYLWQQALGDLGAQGNPDVGEKIEGAITFTSTRDGFDSWQHYTIPFTLDTQGQFLRVAQFSEMVAQTSPTDPADVGPNTAIYASQLAMMAAQEPGDETPGSGDVITSGIYVAGLSTTGGQLTSFYTPINRNLFEAPYAWLRRLGIDGGAAENTGHIVTVAARPSDRLTDTHVIRSRFNYPKGIGATLPYNTAAAPAFTPWATIKFTLQYLETTATIATSSFFDGVPISGVTPGSMALIGAEVVRVVAISEFTIELARGCADTVPQKHNANSRIWFFEAVSGNDPFGYPWITTEPAGSSVEVKMVPAVYGPPLLDADVPTDVLDFNRRALRPLPPGRVVVNGRPWFEGAITKPDSGVMITWASRNRIEQDTEVLDHTAPPVMGEAGQQHRLVMTVWVPSRVRGVPPTKVTVRDILVDGDSYNYSYEDAQADGYKVGRLLGVCGYVSCDLYLSATRDGLESWQGYSILLRLPSYPCAPGETPGGGQHGGSEPGNGNGQPGGDPSNPDQHDDTGAADPIDNGGNGDNGNGPPKPPDPPPEWPDPVDPPPQDDPEDPNPGLAGHWDTNWDRHWDAYKEDNTGGQ